VVDSSPLYHSINIFMEAMTIITSPSMVEAVLVQNTTGDVSLEPKGISIKTYNLIGGIDTLIGTGTGMDPGSGAWRVPELGMGGRRLTVHKTVNQSLTASTVHVTDDELKFWVIEEEVVVFNLTLGYTSPTDVKVCLSGPVGCVCFRQQGRPPPPPWWVQVTTWCCPHP